MFLHLIKLNRDIYGGQSARRENRRAQGAQFENREQFASMPPALSPLSLSLASSSSSMRPDRPIPSLTAVVLGVGQKARAMLLPWKTQGGTTWGAEKQIRSVRNRRLHGSPSERQSASTCAAAAWTATSGMKKKGHSCRSNRRLYTCKTRSWNITSASKKVDAVSGDSLHPALPLSKKVGGRGKEWS